MPATNNPRKFVRNAREVEPEHLNFSICRMPTPREPTTRESSRKSCPIKPINYSPVNSMEYHPPHQAWHYIDYILPGLILFPIRLILLGLGMGIMVLCAFVISGGSHDHSKPITSRFRLWFFYPMHIGGRIFLHAFGYWWVTVKGKPVTREEATITVSNHNSLVDPFLLGMFTWPSYLSKLENTSVPIVSRCMRALQCVIVNRDDANSRKNIVDSIIERATSTEGWPILHIFPEGTVSNGKSLIRFKPGAFIPGRPVQPILMYYKYNFFDQSFVAPMTIASLAYRLMVQWYNSVTVEFLPVYYPSEDEKKDPELFMRNVRSVMAKAMGVPTTDYTFEDELMKVRALKMKYPANRCHLLACEFGLLQDQFRIPVQDAYHILQRYGEIDTKRTAYLTKESILRYYFNCTPSSIDSGSRVHRLFEALEGCSTTGGDIMFRDFLYLIMSVRSLEEDVMNTICTEAFNTLMASAPSHKLDVNDFTYAFLAASGIASGSDVQQHVKTVVFAQADGDGDGIVTLPDVQQWLLRFPEYAFTVCDVQRCLVTHNKSTVQEAMKKVVHEKHHDQPMEQKVQHEQGAKDVEKEVQKSTSKACLTEKPESHEAHLHDADDDVHH